MKIKVLIVDDARTIRFHERGLLEEMGYEVDEATDGFNALEKIKNAKPDLMLMDIMMPNMNGIECCRRIKSDPDLKEIKIIIVTSENEYGRVKEAFRAGCDDYISKPIDKVEITRKIGELSELVRHRQKLHDLQVPSCTKTPTKRV
jgi:CheY-like chemotaxis protein